MSTTTSAKLDGPTWTIIEIARTNSKVSAKHSGKITFTGEEIRLNAPCNMFISRTIVTGDSLTIFPFENMPNTCGVEAVELEGAMKRALLMVSSYEVSGDTLILRSFNGTQMIKAAL